jgi:hypothetical protein
MGNLSTYLQHAFLEHCPAGWKGSYEVPLLAPELEKTLGYAPRADVLLERIDGSRRLWIEFEISRADPVANHAKFATANLFLPQPETDTFLSMVSPHVVRGRRNLASNAVGVMRQIGMDAFQTLLLPTNSANEIKYLNHLKLEELGSQQLSIASEIDRAFAVTETVLTRTGRRIHFVGDFLEVVLNLRRWNQEIATEEGRATWGRRTVTYFVYDPVSSLFAPSKFCAYIAIPERNTLDAQTYLQTRSEMTITFYATLDQTDHRFDGQRARKHLTQHLAMTAQAFYDAGELHHSFENWLAEHGEAITVHPQGAVFLMPPAWFV